MVIDTSAIVAILLLEPEAELFVTRIRNSLSRFTPSSVILEASIVLLGRHGELGWQMLDELRRTMLLKTVSFDENQAMAAREAFRLYGKGRHPAGLNFGDCISYALAKTEVMPLLFKGNDFRLTDIEAVL